MERKMSSLACSVFNELRLEGKLCDAVIRVKDREFNAHKNILCSCSPYFRALFTGSWSDAGRRKFTIPGVEPEAMELIIEYAYMRTLPVTCANVERLLVAADQFNVMGIVRLCCAFLREHISFDSCVEVYRFSGFYALHDLQQSAFAFMLQNFEALAGSREQFCELTADELELMLSQDELTVRSEHTAYDAILTWLSGDVEARTRDVPRLLAKVPTARTHGHPRKDRGTGRCGYKQRHGQMCRDTEVHTERQLQIQGHGTDVQRHRDSRRDANTGMHTDTGVQRCRQVQKKWKLSPLHSHFPLSTFTLTFHSYFTINTPLSPPTHNLHSHTPTEWNNVYICGGFNGNECLFTAEHYCPETNAWTLFSPMTVRRSGIGVIACGDRVCAVGGFDGTNRLRSAEEYTPATDSWSPLPEMNQPRSNFGIEVVDGVVYAVGGFNGFTTTFNSECYDRDEGRWFDVSDMSIYRSALSCCVVQGLPNVRDFVAPRD
uniref:Kelch like family member 10 n=1 Tax=Petromyzon marinus TaxID=7757 RepID=S4RRS4_PETMA